MMISGPTPAASPIVIAIIGFLISTFVIQQRTLCLETRRYAFEFPKKIATANERLWRAKCACLWLLPAEDVPNSRQSKMATPAQLHRADAIDEFPEHPGLLSPFLRRLQPVRRGTARTLRLDRRVPARGTDTS